MVGLFFLSALLILVAVAFRLHRADLICREVLMLEHAALIGVIDVVQTVFCDCDDRAHLLQRV